jgi:hypothetical protein
MQGIDRRRIIDRQRPDHLCFLHHGICTVMVTHRGYTPGYPSQVAPLLDQIDDPIGRVTADGALTIAQHGDGIEMVIPPRSTSIPSGEPGPPTQRDRHVAMIAEQGRLAWQAATGYGRRSFSRNDNGSLQVADRTAATALLASGPRLPSAWLC